jgi:hypothetical protein
MWFIDIGCASLPCVLPIVATLNTAYPTFEACDRALIAVARASHPPTNVAWTFNCVKK